MNQEQFGKLLPQTGLSGLYHLSPGNVAALQKAAKSLGYACFAPDLRDISESKSVLRALGKALNFPEWYGANLDALNDCLTDFSWQEAPGYVIVISGADSLHEKTSAFTKLNAVFAHAIDDWRDQGTPFWIFYDMRADGLAALPTLA